MFYRQELFTPSLKFSKINKDKNNGEINEICT